MRARLIPLFALIFVTALPFGAPAAPQILGLVATAEPLALDCADGVCRVEVSSACLQKHRPVPQDGTAYRPADGADIGLIATGPDGRTVRIDAAALATIETLRGFNAVAISLPEPWVREQAGGDAKLAVGALASAVPVPMPGDDAPLTAQEIAAYTGPLRAAAERAFAADAANLAATQVLNGMVNALPADNSLGASPIAGLRDKALGGAQLAAQPRAVPLVARALSVCKEKLRVERTPHLRACLSNQHDILNATMTQDVWQALKPGS